MEKKLRNKRNNVFEKNTKDKTKKNKGITLIALVVTIIVLLILAGISISALTGTNGIISNANNVKLKSENGEVLEKLRLEIYENKLNNTLDRDVIDEITYLKDKNIIVDEVDEEDEKYYIVNIEKLISNSLTGKGTFQTGDAYYILNGYLHYMKKNKEQEELGILFEGVEVASGASFDWQYTILPDETIKLTGFDASSFTDADSSVTYYTTGLISPVERLIIPGSLDGRVVSSIALERSACSYVSNSAGDEALCIWRSEGDCFCGFN